VEIKKKNNTFLYLFYFIIHKPLTTKSKEKKNSFKKNSKTKGQRRNSKIQRKRKYLKKYQSNNSILKIKQKKQIEICIIIILKIN